MATEVSLKGGVDGGGGVASELDWPFKGEVEGGSGTVGGRMPTSITDELWSGGGGGG